MIVRAHGYCKHFLASAGQVSTDSWPLAAYGDTMPATSDLLGQRTN